MFAILVFVVLVTCVTSFCCSLTEAALLAVPLAHVKHLADQGSRRAKILLGFKEELGEPIAAILIVNTIANTVGPSLFGAMVAHTYGDRILVAFSIVLTLAILYIGEIIPKKIGAVYAKHVALQVAVPLKLAVNAMYPLVKIAEYITRSFQGDTLSTVSGEEVISLAEIGREEGVIDHLEGSIIKNVIGLDRRMVKDILTPRVVVFRLPDHIKVGDVKSDILEWNHTRVPIFSDEEPDIVNRYIIQRDLFRALIRNELDRELREFARPLGTIPELMRADKLLLQMFEQGEFIYSVVDEHGGFAGLVTLEDVVEEVVGREIIDEYDLVGDLRSYAQILHHARRKRLGTETDS